jgi:putative transposase
MAEQARNLSEYFAEQPSRPTMLLRDHDGKFSEEFDSILAADTIAVNKVGPLAPNLNAYAERWVQSVRGECLDHFVVFGEEHLRLLLREYEAYFNERRPHQSLANVPPAGAATVEETALTVEEVLCDERLGGLLKHYYRQAA